MRLLPPKTSHWQEYELTMRSKILVVDDNDTNLLIVTEILGDEFELRTATSGREALEVAAEFCPDVVLLDVMMPGLDGYATCRLLRAQDEGVGTRIVMVSAKAMPSERQTGFDAGADDYLTKPFDDAELLAMIRDCTRRVPSSA